MYKNYDEMKDSPTTAFKEAQEQYRNAMDHLASYKDSNDPDIPMDEVNCTIRSDGTVYSANYAESQITSKNRGNGPIYTDPEPITEEYNAAQQAKKAAETAMLKAAGIDASLSEDIANKFLKDAEYAYRMEDLKDTLAALAPPPSRTSSLLAELSDATLSIDVEKSGQQIPTAATDRSRQQRTNTVETAVSDVSLDTPRPDNRTPSPKDKAPESKGFLHAITHPGETITAIRKEILESRVRYAAIDVAKEESKAAAGWWTALKDTVGEAVSFTNKGKLQHAEAVEARHEQKEAEKRAKVSAKENTQDFYQQKLNGIEDAQSRKDTATAYEAAREALRAVRDADLEALEGKSALERAKGTKAIYAAHEKDKKLLKTEYQSQLDDITVRRHNPQLDKCKSYAEAEREMKKSKAPTFEEKTVGENKVQTIDDPRYPADQKKSRYADLTPAAYEEIRKAHQLTLTVDKTGKVTQVEAGKDTSFTMLCNGQMITKRGGQIESKFGDAKDIPVIMVDKKDVTDSVKHTPEKPGAAGVVSALTNLADKNKAPLVQANNSGAIREVTVRGVL